MSFNFGSERMRNNKPVLCVEDGIRYESIREAAIAASVSHPKMSYSIRKEKPINGKRYIFIEEKADSAG